MKNKNKKKNNATIYRVEKRYTEANLIVFLS